MATSEELTTAKTDRRPIADDPRLFIESLGYDIDVDSDQPSRWIWTAPSDGSGISFDSAKEALDGAWNDALAQTLEISDISCEEWGSMDIDAQRVAMTLALSGELPFLDVLSPDTQMMWVSRIRESYPDIDSKEAFQLAGEDYVQNDGVLPKPVASIESQKG